jgi:hypothetical protein
MSRCSSQALVLPLGQVPRLSRAEVRRHDILGRIASAVAGILEEAEQGSDNGQLAPSGVVGQRLPIKVGQEALEMTSLYLLDGQHLASLQIVDQLPKIRQVLTPCPQCEVAARQVGIAI